MQVRYAVWLELVGKVQNLTKQPFVVRQGDRREYVYYAQIVKRGSPDKAVARFDPASCRACAPVTTPLYNAENARETVVE